MRFKQIRVKYAKNMHCIFLTTLLSYITKQWIYFYVSIYAKFLNPIFDNSCNLFPTFHPNRHISSTVVSPRTLCGHEVTRGSLEPIPSFLEVTIADRGLAEAKWQMVVEGPMGFVGDHVMRGGVTGVVGGSRFREDRGWCGWGAERTEKTKMN